MKRTLKYVSGLLALIGIVFFTTIFIVAANYQISSLAVGKSLVRLGVLNAVNFAVSVYDPTPAREDIKFFPNETKDALSSAFDRIETFSENTSKDWKLKLIDVKNETIVRSSRQFHYQPFNEPRLKELRKKYKLDEIVKNEPDEFSKMLALRNWSRSQFRRNDFQPAVANFDALAVLDQGHRNTNNEPRKNGYFTPCNFFPRLYSQIMVSMGYQIRICGLSHTAYDKNDLIDSHGVTEVWSNQYNKWIEMDADLNHHYVKDGIPLNILEIHNLTHMGKSSEINIVRGMQTSGDNEWKKDLGHFDMFGYHNYFRIVDMRNDWLTNFYFRGHPKRSDLSALFWQGPHFPKAFTIIPVSGNPDDFYWSLNRTEIRYDKKASEGPKIELQFNTYTPNFKEFIVVVDNDEIFTSETAFFTWNLHYGMNTLAVKSRNRFDIEGVESLVQIQAE